MKYQLPELLAGILNLWSIMGDNMEKDCIVIQYVNEAGNITSSLTINTPKKLEADCVRGNIHLFLTSIGIEDCE